MVCKMVVAVLVTVEVPGHKNGKAEDGLVERREGERTFFS